ncbi:MAG: MBOAT family protein [Betaproteobacteria bacterium]|nr:MAG: MBOAT family protein [Betaproteobacteria bacterium]
MLFNSVEFIFGFLPVTALIFFGLARWSHPAAAAWMAFASLFFYGWWNWTYVPLLMASAAFNYACGARLARFVRLGRTRAAGTLFAFAVAANLLLLGYYKYANFLLGTWGSVTGHATDFGQIILPLGISFFTFTQIAFLADVRRGYAREYNPIHYGLFVTYFPHLIAGPILHHKEMMPQFQEPRTYRLNAENVAVGLTIFFIGLFKKTVIADGVAAYASPLFVHPGAPDLFAAWGGALAYTLQLYFDFSGYSDMAIGLSRVFGVKLPLNFDSPYKAVNIIDFWRRWHMTLSRFLRDYLYVSLGGNRKGKTRRYINLFVTMLLGGLWHGAGWTFVLWGGLHGVYLVVNHAWRALRERLGQNVDPSTRTGRALARLTTFVAVVIGWVFFRATSLDDASAILRGMAGLNGMSLPASLAMYVGPAPRAVLERLGLSFHLGGGAHFVFQYLWLTALLPLVMLAPNTQEILGRFQPALSFRGTDAAARLAWRPTARWAAMAAVVAACGLLSLTRVSEFLYYQF